MAGVVMFNQVKSTNDQVQSGNVSFLPYLDQLRFVVVRQ